MLVSNTFLSLVDGWQYTHLPLPTEYSNSLLRPSRVAIQQGGLDFIIKIEQEILPP